MSVGHLFGIASCFAGLVTTRSQHVAAQVTAPMDTRSRIVRQFPCTPTKYSLKSAQSTLPGEACSLARLAVHQIALGKMRSGGLQPTDTANVISATIAAFRFAGLRGTPSENYWTVSLALSNRERPVVVRIDQDTGKIRVIEWEGPTNKAR
jgi:hypothetical protein